MKNEKTWNLLGFVFGLVVTAVGVFFMINGSVSGAYFTRSASFGGDFYTYIYEAATLIVENIYWVAKGLEDGLQMFGFLTSAFGFLVALHYGKLVFCSKKEVPHRTASSADYLDG